MVNNTLKRSRTYLGTRFSGAILSYGIGTRLEITVLSSGYGVLAALAIFILFCSSPLLALPVEELDPNREWRTKDLVISGNKQIGASEVEDALSTKTRPWYAPWRSRPVFDPAVFASDLDRIVKLYQDKGYYETKVTHDLDVDTTEGLVTATIHV